MSIEGSRWGVCTTFGDGVALGVPARREGPVILPRRFSGSLPLQVDVSKSDTNAGQIHTSLAAC